MFSLVALMCLYLGGNNIRKAFILAPFSEWVLINWSLFIMGVLLLFVGVRCIWQASKDYKEAKATKEEQAKAEQKERQRQFFYDDEETFEEASDYNEE